MSMPEFPKPDTDISYEQALNMILLSIALEEISLSNILNAESERIKFMLSNPCSGTNEVLASNKSVASILEMVLQSQMILKNKMEKVLSARSSPNTDLSSCPPPYAPPCSLPRPSLYPSYSAPSYPRPIFLPGENCAVFENAFYRWQQGCGLPLKMRSCSFASLDPRDRCKIILPRGQYMVCLKMRLEWPPKENIIISLRLSDNATAAPAAFNIPCKCNYQNISCNSIVNIPANRINGSLKLCLMSPQSVKVEHIELRIIAL